MATLSARPWPRGRLEPPFGEVVFNTAQMTGYQEGDHPIPGYDRSVSFTLSLTRNCGQHRHQLPRISRRGDSLKCAALIARPKLAPGPSSWRFPAARWTSWLEAPWVVEIAG